MSARLAPSTRPLPLLFVALLFLLVFPWPSPPWVINVIIIRLDTSWPGLQRLELTSTSNLLPPLSLAPLPVTSTPIISMPLTYPTTSFLPTLAHERSTSPLFWASAFASRSFSVFILIFSAFAPSGNKRHRRPAHCHYQHLAAHAGLLFHRRLPQDRRS